MALDEYRKKRAANKTPEPFGSELPPSMAANTFVVQKHAARRVHYDFRLELGGVLVSWAVPKGPSLDPAIKRLAVQVEDHPVEYADFEGIIPPGNYGAGAVIVWDRGAWKPLEDPVAGLKKGHLDFELIGYKLRGQWMLIRTQGSENEWLLIKKPDTFAAGEGQRLLPSQSVLSGLELEEVGAAPQRASELGVELEKAGAKKRDLKVENIELMLAQVAPEPFSDLNWIFELKYDGYRLLSERRDGRVKLRYRSGLDATHLFPDLVRALEALPYSLVLDGEVVVLDGDGKPTFGELQQRVQLQRPQDIARASIERPATYYVFDLLAFDGWDLRNIPLGARKTVLQSILPRLGPLRFADHVEAEGAALFEEVKRRGLEGVMAKRIDSPYASGRSSQWLKMKTEQTGDFVVIGFTPPDKVSRTGFRALQLAVREG
jgi:bifunctional non-homologous end joining protein LigD